MRRQLHPEGFGAGAFSGYDDFRHGDKRRPVTLAGGPLVNPQAQAAPAEALVIKAGRRAHLVSRAVEAMSEWRSTPFENEGPMTQALRANLCLVGMPWRRADKEAGTIVASALKEIGIPRPTWDEGQADILDSPDRCAWCAGPVDDPGNGKASRYCSSVCAKSALESRDFVRRDGTNRAFSAAYRMVQRAKTTARKCEECGGSFQPIREKSKQRFCSFSCGSKNRSRRTAPPNHYAIAVSMPCAYCGEDFEARERKAALCSKRCAESLRRLRKGAEPQKMKPHVFDRYVTSLVEPPKMTPQRFDFLLWQGGATITGEAMMPQPRVTDGLFA